jgi:FAD/FMN-containing dehydrogenase
MWPKVNARRKVATVPALVLQPTSAHDVAAAVDFARDHGLLLSIKGGGHNIAGTAIAQGGLTLDLSRMREVAVDPGARLAHVGPGACSVTSTRPPRPTGWPPCSGSCPRPASPA